VLFVQHQVQITNEYNFPMRAFIGLSHPLMMQYLPSEDLGGHHEGTDVGVRDAVCEQLPQQNAI